jgi:hypothetical protein
MKLASAVLLLVCAISYKLAQLSLEDLHGYAAFCRSQASSLVSDPIGYCEGVYEILDKTGGLR